MSTLISDRPMLRLEIDVGSTVTVGKVGGVTRRCIPLTGGAVSGDYRGRLIPGGSD
jgi:hypothetical protein